MSTTVTLPVTIDDIKQALASPLPGVIGQKKMAPAPTTDDFNRFDGSDDCREASVLLILYPRENDQGKAELCTVLIRRPDYPGVHSGQIALPGGRREPEESLRGTALREAYEEVGVLPEALQIIGRLSQLYTPPSNYCIFPFVAFSAQRPVFQPDPREVAELLEVPLHLFFDPTLQKEETWHFEQYGERRVPYFYIFGHKVWGATAMILGEFVTLLSHRGNKNYSSVDNT